MCTWAGCVAASLLYLACVCIGVCVFNTCILTIFISSIIDRHQCVQMIASSSVCYCNPEETLRNITQIAYFSSSTRDLHSPQAEQRRGDGGVGEHG